MQRCPKCGYREGTDWLSILCIVAVGLLYVAFILVADGGPRDIRAMGLAAYLFFIAATIWKGLREKRSRKEYLKLHPPVTERMKSHIKPSPAAGGN